MYCEICGVVIGNTMKHCYSCEYKIEKNPNYLDYRMWVMATEFEYDAEAMLYDSRNSYHTCIRCGEMLMGVERSVEHWDSKHREGLYPHGVPIVAGTTV